MIKSNSSMAQQIAQVAMAFEEQRTGHRPRSATVVLSENILVITLHGALSPAETALARNPAGAAELQEFHKQLFHNSASILRAEIKAITGVEVREAAEEVETTTGTVVQAFTSGTVVQVFLLACNVPTDTWKEELPLAEKKKHTSSEDHHKAASRHEVAAHHHRQAARHHDNGNHDEAKNYATSAQDHSQDADRHSKAAHQHSENAGAKIKGAQSEAHWQDDGGQG